MIDVLNGVAVHATRGERKRYLPLRSVLCKSADPLDVALVFESFGFDNLYLADLDAILGKLADFALYQQIKTRTNLDFMVDAGITDITKAQKVLEKGASKIVIGTETLTNLSFVDQAVKSFGEDCVVVSIDLKDERVTSVSESIRSMNVVSLVERLERMGVEQIIILDLDRVGTECGVNLKVVKRVLKETGVKVLVGGGIRGIKDLKELRDFGVYGSLIATILHKGKIKVEELKSAGVL
ncbi:MAG: HisA/HisF-related TIM barrel protein [Candidatus Bathyarchaeia archaeon]